MVLEKAIGRTDGCSQKETPNGNGTAMVKRRSTVVDRPSKRDLAVVPIRERYFGKARPTAEGDLAVRRNGV